jgi:hypothetical protein
MSICVAYFSPSISAVTGAQYKIVKNAFGNYVPKKMGRSFLSLKEHPPLPQSKPNILPGNEVNEERVLSHPM